MAVERIAVQDGFDSPVHVVVAPPSSVIVLVITLPDAGCVADASSEREEILEACDCRAAISSLAGEFKQRSKISLTPSSKTTLSGKVGFRVAYVNIHC